MAPPPPAPPASPNNENDLRNVIFYSTVAFGMFIALAAEIYSSNEAVMYWLQLFGYADMAMLLILVLSAAARFISHLFALMLLLAVVATAAQIRVCGEVEEEGEKGFLCGGLYVGSRMLMFAVEVAAMARVGGF